MQIRPYYLYFAIPSSHIELITITHDPILLGTANDLISSEKIVPHQIGVLSEAAEPFVFGPVDAQRGEAHLCDG